MAAIATQARQQSRPAPIAPADLKLYEIPGLWEDLAGRIDDAGGELSPELEAELDRLQECMQAKAEGCCILIRRWETQAEGLRQEADRLARFAMAREKAALRLKQYVLCQLERADMTKLETARFRLRIQQNSRPTIRWLGLADDLPPEFRRVTVEADGQAAYQAWKRDGELPTGFVVDQGRHLRIQ